MRKYFVNLKEGAKILYSAGFFGLSKAHKRWRGNQLVSRLMEEKGAKAEKYRKSLDRIFPRIRTMVVDIDGTLINSSTTLEALKQVYGKREGTRIHDNLLKDVKEGRLSIDQALLKGHELLVIGGFTKADWDKIIDRLVKNKLRIEVVSALQKLHERGIKVVLATRSSDYVAKELARRLGFDGGVGSKEVFSPEKNPFKSKVKGLDTLVSDRFFMRGVKTKPKWKAVRDYLKEMQSDEYRFNPRNTAFLADEFTDAKMMRKVRYGFLLPSEKPVYPSLTRVSEKYELYDRKIPHNYVEKELELFTLFPWLTRFRGRELKEVMKKIS
ncbi:MAG: HAD family hydrolase [archaeon]